MGSDRGSDIVSSFGPVAVAPLPPFEWRGVESINVGYTEFKALEPVMVVSGCILHGINGNNHYLELFLKGKNLTPQEFNGQTLTINIENGSLTVGTMEWSNVEPDGSHYYDVNFELDESEFRDIISFRLSPPDEAFVITCVDVIKV